MPTIEREFYDLIYEASREWRQAVNGLMGCSLYAETFIDVLMMEASEDLVLALPQIVSVDLPRDRPEGYEHKRCHPALILDYRPGRFDLLDEDPNYYLPLMEELLQLCIRLARIDMVLILDNRQAWWLAVAGVGSFVLVQS